MKKPKTKITRRRLDVAVALGAGISRERAQSLIMAGRVRVDGATALKAGSYVAFDANIDVKPDAVFVGRGGMKLEKALVEFDWRVTGLRCLDVGASTGGFTDCLLKHGAASVTAVDVGYGQLAWSLRNDARVTVIERCNFRVAQPHDFGVPFEFACADVSFISLTKLARNLADALIHGGRLVALVKPQFEAGRRAAGKGVVRDQLVHARTIETVADAFDANGLAPIRLAFSPLRGPAGNIEFLLGAEAGGARAKFDTAGVVRAAHEALAR